MIERRGIIIPKDKVTAFKKAAVANARSHDAEYWRKSRELTSRKLDFERINKLCGYDK